MKPRFGSAKATDSDAETNALKACSRVSVLQVLRRQEINELVKKPEFVR